jgi:peptide/nickel transport system permease protein
MKTVLLRRVLQSAVVLLVMSVLVFTGIFAVGNPVDVLVSPQADQAEIERITRQLGLDRPLWEQYGRFLSQALRGDLGQSFVHSTSALGLILERLPATLELAVVAMGLAVLIGIPLGLLAGLKPDSAAGRGVMAGSIVGFSLPTFWVGLMLILLFSVQLGWLPSNGRGQTVDVFGVPLSLLTADGWAHLALPALNLALFKISLVIRLTAAGTREAMLQDYVKFARAKGLKPSRIVGVHVLKIILVPIVTVVGLEFGSVIAFAVVTETVFSWPGVGLMFIQAVTAVDIPVMAAYLVLVAFFFVVINLVVDLLYYAVDPRLRVERGAAYGHGG